MARAHYVKKSRKDIYVHGRPVTYISQKGKRAGTKMSKVDRTQPANKQDEILIPKGSGYWFWQFKGGPVIYSATRPKQSQLTRSEFLQTYYGIVEDMEDATIVSDAEQLDPSDIQVMRDEWVSQIEELRDTCQERLDSMPENLQQSSDSGTLLQERIDALDSWISELEGVDIDWDDEEFTQNAEEEWQQLHTAALQQEDPKVLEEKDAWVKDRARDLKLDKINEVIAELQNTDPGIS